jgi:hypothetical protein
LSYDSLAMPEENVRDLVRRVREQLQAAGPLGAFLLAELDSSISRGVDDDAFRKIPPKGQVEHQGRRAANEVELFEILSGVLETYLVTLPSAAREFNNFLKDKFQVDHFEIAVDPSLLDNDIQVAGRATWERVVPSTNERLIGAMKEINTIVQRVRRTRGMEHA